MDPIKFGEDLARKADLATALIDYNFNWPDLSGQTLHFMGMGSSAYAAQSIVTRLQAAGVEAYFTLASNPLMPKATSNKSLIVISATGNSIESKSAYEQAVGYRDKIWLTNSKSISPNQVSLNAGEESGGVASLTYLATQIALLRLAEHLGAAVAVRGAIEAAASAISDIYQRKDEWLPELRQHVDSPAGSFFIAPADRFCSAAQSSLLMRECPRLPSVGCETGDWAHVDLYLTKTLDYRALLFSGGAWQEQLFEWTKKRSASVVTIGFEHPAATAALHYKNENQPLVPLLAEVGFAELLAQNLWLNQL